ncbi:MAG: hypothetical protein ACM3X0_05340 [Bacteroidota bacterium]
MKSLARAIAWLLLILVLLASGADSTASETLGRLFLTPAQRNALDRQRQTDARFPTSDAGKALTLDGEIRRSNGRRVRRWVRDPAGDAEDDSQVPALAVGSSYHPATGERDDLLGGGRIRIEPGSAAK